jgi:hypothetical protein
MQGLYCRVKKLLPRVLLTPGAELNWPQLTSKMPL